MTANTPALQMARLALSALSPGERSALLSEMAEAKPDQIMTRAEVAQRFNRTPRTVDQWAARNLLRKVKLPGSSRAVGFRRSDVEGLLSGSGA